MVQKLFKRFKLSLANLPQDISKFEVLKPYPNEHACRLAEPGQFARFARGTRQSGGGGKTYSVIFGFLSGGGSKDQAYRYPKDSWSADEARSHCSSHGGRFEAASEAKQEKFESSIYKASEDMTFGKLNIKKGQELRYVLGVVLEPEILDATTTEKSIGDIYSEDEVRKAAHYFMAKYKGSGNDLMHNGKDNDNLVIVESYLAPSDVTINGTNVKKGTWLMGTLVMDDAIWRDVKTGKYTGYSIGGIANGRFEAATVI